MLLQRCSKKHFYDSDKFAECPYCAIEKSGLEEVTRDFPVISLEETEPVINRQDERNDGGNGRL